MILTETPPTTKTIPAWRDVGNSPPPAVDSEEALLSPEQRLTKDYHALLAKLQSAPSPESLKIFEAGVKAQFVGIKTTITARGVYGSVDVEATTSRLETLKRDAQSPLPVQERVPIIDWYINKIKTSPDGGVSLYTFLVNRQTQVV